MFVVSHLSPKPMREGLHNPLRVTAMGLRINRNAQRQVRSAAATIARAPLSARKRLANARNWSQKPVHCVGRSVRRLIRVRKKIPENSHFCLTLVTPTGLEPVFSP